MDGASKGGSQDLCDPIEKVNEGFKNQKKGNFELDLEINRDPVDLPEAGGCISLQRAAFNT